MRDAAQSDHANANIHAFNASIRFVDAPPPKLSVVVAVESEAKAVLACLCAIEKELRGIPAEIILVDSEETYKIANMTALKAPAASTLFEKRLLGILHARGELIGVVGDRYEVQPGWAAAAIKSEVDVLAGCVEAPAQASRADRAIYLAEYSHVALRTRELDLDRAEAVSVPGGNVVYKRAALARGVPAGVRSESEFHKALFDAGLHLRRGPALLASFAHPPSLEKYLAERYAVSRDWAAARCAGADWFLRTASALTRLALPVLLFWRWSRSALSRPRYRGWFLSALPYLVLFSVVQAAGECAGCFKGRSRSGNLI